MLKDSLRYVVKPFGVGLAVAVLSFVQVGCGGGGISASGTDQVGITVSSLMITLENKSGVALTDIRATIEPSGLQKTVYAVRVGRMESTEKRDISLSDFRVEDGTPYSTRIRAKAVRVTANGIDGQQYEAVVPWD